MSYADRVRQARNPQEALLVVAEGIDAILARSPAADPWGWADPVEAKARQIKQYIAENGGERFDLVSRENEIAAVEAALQTEHDPEERRALEARLRLLTDDGKAINIDPPEGRREQFDEETGMLVIPPPSPEKYAARRAFAPALAGFSTLPEAEFIEAYAKGGPMWLYAGNRDGVMQMPMHLRQALVTDVQEDSPRAAQEMGRDILKDRSSNPPAFPA